MRLRINRSGIKAPFGNRKILGFLSKFKYFYGAKLAGSLLGSVDWGRGISWSWGINWGWGINWSWGIGWSRGIGSDWDWGWSVGWNWGWGISWLGSIWLLWFWAWDSLVFDISVVLLVLVNVVVNNLGGAIGQGYTVLS